MRRFLVVALMGFAVGWMFGGGPVLAAHNGNNKAELSGSGISGTAIMNYSEGTGTFSGHANVQGLAAGSYTYRVNNSTLTNPQTICTFEASGSGSAGCSAQHLSLAGFAVAQIVDQSSNVVASGTFARRGNCRDPDQAGSQCEANSAPGQQP
ncbi:MAG: hypothetical protein ACRDH6_04370 [Actinomycetota bacterium]